MASHPILPGLSAAEGAGETERRLSSEQGWNLIFSLFGSAKDIYAEFGGGEAWIQAEREAWTPGPSA